MKIPKQFKLLGTIIKVRNKDKLTFDSDAWGLSVFRENKIILQKPTKINPIKEELREQTFCHELVHMIFHKAGEEELCANEKLVNLLGSLLHQFLKTKKGELK